MFERNLPDSRYHTWLKAKKTALLTPPCLDPVTSPEEYQRNALALSQEQSKEPLWYEVLTVPKPAHESVASAPGKAQVLTSASFLLSLAEKEKMKKEAAEEKER